MHTGVKSKPLGSTNCLQNPEFRLQQAWIKHKHHKRVHCVFAVWSVLLSPPFPTFLYNNKVFTGRENKGHHLLRGRSEEPTYSLCPLTSAPASRKLKWKFKPWTESRVPLTCAVWFISLQWYLNNPGLTHNIEYHSYTPFVHQLLTRWAGECNELLFLMRFYFIAHNVKLSRGTLINM